MLSATFGKHWKRFEPQPEGFRSNRLTDVSKIFKALSSIKCDSVKVYVSTAPFLPKLADMDIQYRKRVAKNVRTLREKMGLSQESLAERADMHWTYISGVERAKYNLSLSSLVSIAKALGREPYELLR